MFNDFFKIKKRWKNLKNIKNAFYKKKRLNYKRLLQLW